MKKIISFILLVAIISCTREEINYLELPSIISSGMVLQRNTDVALWGKGSPGSKIILSTNWGEKTRVQVKKDSTWLTTIKTGDAGGPWEMQIQSGDTAILIKDILFGEVWLCSGQSNMEMPLKGWPPNDMVENWKVETAKAQHPDIRMITILRNISPSPLRDCSGSWIACTPGTVPEFSATAYFFGRELKQQLNVPVGLIHSSWGGTPAESWTSKEFLREIPAYGNIVDSLDEIQADFDSLVAWMQNLNNLTIDAGDDLFYTKLDCREEEFSVKELDHSSWPVMHVPALWETSALPNFDGMVWFRHEFDLPAQMENKDLTLYLGPIDDMDITYLNGEKIGETMVGGKWNEERVYKIPSGLLRRGKNVLAVCVVDNTGGGGLYSDEDLMIRSSDGMKVMLSGDWHFQPVAEIMGNTIFLYEEGKSYQERPKLKYSLGAYTPSVLFNAMINPLVPYTIKGCIWYQGESNVGKGYEYRTLFPALIKSWREHWAQEDLPFYYVQIAPYDYGEEERSQTAEVREAQLLSLGVPYTGMVVTTDIGNVSNIHPGKKAEVGRRLALWALARDYGFDSLVCSGPLYDSITITGNRISVSFQYADDGLVCKGEELTHFEIAGEDQVFVPARAMISGDRVEVWSDEVQHPVAVRFGWSAIAEPNLFNVSDLPASPFRTDNWKRLSE